MWCFRAALWGKCLYNIDDWIKESIIQWMKSQYRRILFDEKPCQCNGLFKARLKHFKVLVLLLLLLYQLSQRSRVQIATKIYCKFCKAFDLYHLIKLLWKINGVQSRYGLFLTHVSVVNGEVYLSQSLGGGNISNYKGAACEYIFCYSYEFKFLGKSKIINRKGLCRE